mmetsp:Transcript_131958/g.239981  ORF Transcript_131958/g.239981 Transcript_131958/m.239981 type:complete len:300 (+) Transcript_131958:58-957(+)
MEPSAPCCPRCPLCRAENEGEPMRANGCNSQEWVCPICLDGPNDGVSGADRWVFPCSHEVCTPCLIKFYAHTLGAHRRLADENARLEDENVMLEDENETLRRRRDRDENAFRRVRDENEMLRQLRDGAENALDRVREMLRAPRQLNPYLLQGPFGIGSIVRINVPRWHGRSGRNKFEVNLLTAKGNVAFHWGARHDYVVCNSRVHGKWQKSIHHSTDHAPSRSRTFSIDIEFHQSHWCVKFCNLSDEPTRSRSDESTLSYIFQHRSYPVSLADDPVNVIELSRNLQDPTMKLLQDSAMN